MDISLDFDAICGRVFKACNQKTLGGIAKVLEMSKGAPDGWRKNKKIPGDVLIKISIVFDVSIDYLVFGTEPMAEKSKVDKAFMKSMLMLVGTQCMKKGENYNEELIKMIGDYFYKTLNNESVENDITEMEKLVNLTK